MSDSVKESKDQKAHPPTSKQETSAAAVLTLQDCKIFDSNLYASANGVLDNYASADILLGQDGNKSEPPAKKESDQHIETPLDTEEKVRSELKADGKWHEYKDLFDKTGYLFKGKDRIIYNISPLSNSKKDNDFGYTVSVDWYGNDSRTTVHQIRKSAQVKIEPGKVIVAGKDSQITITPDNPDGVMLSLSDEKGITKNWRNKYSTEYKDGSKDTYFYSTKIKQHETPYKSKEDGHIIGTLVQQSGPEGGDNRTYESGDELKREKDKLLTSLSDSFHVSFSSDTDPPIVYHGREYICRGPSYNDLLAAKEALLKSQPGQLTANGNGVKISYLTGETGTRMHGFYVDNSVFIMPNEESTNITEMADPKEDSEHVGQGPVALLMHEVDHNSDMKLNPRTKDEKKLKELGAKFGFDRIVDKTTVDETTGENKTIWVMLGNNGKIYKSTDEGPVECDRDGTVMGEPLSISQLRAVALKKTVSGYATDPYEVMAEGLTAFRMGGAWKGRLQNECSWLDDIVKDHIQKEIDLHKKTGWKPVER